MKINDYNQMMAHMRRPGFQDGTIVPPPKPEQKTPFIDKLRTLKKAAPGLMPRSKVAILKMYMDEALRDGEITKEQHTEMLMPYFGELGENVTKQIERSDRENFSDGTKKYDYSNPLQKNQYVMRTTEEIQEIINDPKYKDYTRKDFRNEGILTRKETEREALEFKNFGKKKKKPENLENTKRTEKIKKTQGSNISVRGSGQTGKQFSHVYPLIESAKPGTQTTFTIDAKMNRALEGYNKIGQDIAEAQEKLIIEKPDGFEKKIVELNAKAKKNVMNAVNDLGKDYKGQIGYFQVDPTTGEFKPKAGNYKMSFAGIEGENKIFKDMTGKERKDFERKISAIEEAKKVPGVTTADKIPLPEKTKTMNMFKNANMRLKAELLPGLQEIVKGIENIPDDIAKKRYFKLGLKALGPIGTFIAVDDTFEKLKEGKSVAEALEYGLIGTNVIGSTKDLMALSPEGKEARSVVKQQEMREQIANDFSGLDTDFDTPNVKSDMSRQEAERKWENEKIAISRKRAAEEKAIANARAVSIEGLKNLILGTRFQPAEIPKEFLATGGRVGYASKGKVDLSDLESLKGFESDSEEVIENKAPTVRRSMGRLGPQSQRDRIKNKVISSFIYAVDNMDQENSTYVKDLFTNNLANIQIGYETDTSGIKTDLFEKVGIIPINSETLYSTIVNLDLPKDIKAEMSAISSKAGDEELSASLKKNNMGITWDSDSQEIQGEYQFNSKDGKTSMRPVITKDEDSQISKELKIDQAIGDGTLNLTLNESDIDNASGSSINYQNDSISLFADKQSDDWGNTAKFASTVDIPLYLLNKEEKPYISAEINKNLDTGFESKQFSGSFPITDNLKLWGNRYEDDQGDWNNTNYGLGYYKSGKIGELGNWFADANIDKDKDWGAQFGISIPLGKPEKRAYNYSTSDPEEIFDLYKDTDGFKYRPNVNWKESTTEKMFAEGGRIGFADGPDDPKRRKFMKIAGGIASIPFVGKYFKAAAPVAEKTVEIIRRGADGMPDFISDLITKVITFGKKTFTGGRADEIAENYQLDDYVVTKQGNKTTVKKVDDQGEFGYKEHEMEVDYDPETGGYTYNEASVRPDAEGKLKDVEEFIEDIDLEDMRKYTYDD